MGKLDRKFKKTIKSRNIQIRDASIMISQYLKDVHENEIKPVTIYKEFEEENFLRNWYLAKAHYAKLYGIKPQNDRPDNPPDGEFWIDKEYNVSKYNQLTGTWIPITKPYIPDE